MFGIRRRELEKAAKPVAGQLIEKAVEEDQKRRGAANDSILTGEEYASTLAAWAATAGLVWKRAKCGDPDALRQTARNYVFGTGMPVKPRKARLWLDVARILEEIEQPFAESSVDPFWDDMAEALNGILTPKEPRRLAMQWSG